MLFSAVELPVISIMKSLVLMVLFVTVVAAQYDQDYDKQVEAFRRALIAQRMSRRGQASYMASETDDSSLTAAQASIKKNCDENGPPGAYQNVQMAIVEFQSCIQDALIYTPQSSYGGIRESVRYGCRLAPKFGTCVINLGEAVKPCMTPKKRENFALANLTKSVISYACDNDGAETYAFIIDDGQACVRSQISEIEQCAANQKLKDVINSIENSIESGEVTESNCKEAAELRQCVESKLDSCPTPGAKNFFNGLFDIFDSYSSCKEQSQPERFVDVVSLD